MCLLLSLFVFTSIFMCLLLSLYVFTSISIYVYFYLYLCLLLSLCLYFYLCMCTIVSMRLLLRSLWMELTCKSSSVLERDMNRWPRLVDDHVSVGQDQSVWADDEAGAVAHRHRVAGVEVLHVQVLNLEMGKRPNYAQIIFCCLGATANGRCPTVYKFWHCPSCTVSIVLAFHKHNSLPLGQIRDYISFY